MNAPLLEPPLWRHLTDTFHDSTLQRGRDYAQRKRVSATRTWQDSDGTHYLEASVLGSEPKPYHVTVTLGEGLPVRYAIEGRCTCPVGYNCKHAAASVMSYFKLRRATAATSFGAGEPGLAKEDIDAFLASSPGHPRSGPGLLRKLLERGLVATAAPVTQAPVRETALVDPARLPPAHAQWLTQLRALHAPKARAAPRTHKLVLRLQVDENMRPMVGLMYGQLRTDGSLASLQEANSDWFALLRNRPRYLGEDDIPLVQRLHLASEQFSIQRFLTRDAALLREFIEAGKAVVPREAPVAPTTAWPGGTGMPGYGVAPGAAAGLRYVRGSPSFGEAPLRWGEPRAATGAWRADERGRQRFVLEVQPAARVFVLEGLWYLDAMTAECGAINADLDADTAAILLRAPAIEPHEAAAVAHELDRGFKPLADNIARLPKPKAMPVRKTSAPGVVHVRLTSTAPESGSRYYGPPECGAWAHVQVRYGDVPVALDDHGSPRLVKDELVAPTIDTKLHEKTGHRLVSQGFQPNYTPPGSTSDVSIFFLHESRVINLMQDALPRWRKSGWVIAIDPDFEWQLVDSGPISIDTESQTGNAWFSVDLGVDVEGRRISLLPVLARMLSDRNLHGWLADTTGKTKLNLTVRVDERRFITLPADRVRTILQTLVELHQVDPDKPAKLRLARTDALRLHELAGNGVLWNAPEPLRRLGERLASFTAIEEAPVPANLRAELRPYQRSGLSWLQFLREHELAGILADDMGLGKTVQAIAHVLTEQAAGRLTAPALVVAPTSVVHNWQMEIARFAPDLKVLVLQGPARASAFGQIDKSDVVLSTYPLLSRDIEELSRHQFHLAIFDEAQNLKNARTRTSEAATQLRATHRIAMTGTPLENNLAELWSQFHLLMPGFLGESRRFAQLYRTPIEKHGDALRRAHLARRIKPFILRRTKDMVARELPPKTEIEHSVELEGAQRDLYETVRATMEKKVRDALAKRGLAQSHIIVLDALLKLRQVCCDPRLMPSAAAKKVAASAKLERLTELLPELIAEGRRILLFSQFTSMLDLIEPVLHELKINFVRLTGDTRDRKTPVERFQKGEVPLFLISLKAGGTGLNLTAADTVIHYDPWWNPAVENQATDRAHRIGQDKPVFVHRLIAAGTVEERIRAMQARKADLARGILDEDAALAKALSAEDFQALFEPLSA